MDSRINIFAGHFGSGKTELALNFAINAAKEGKKVSIIDIDIVNTYFRTADAKKILDDYGITLICSEFANSNLDMPTVPPAVERVFFDPDTIAVFDVGGDDDGAIALGRYKQYFDRHGYKMYLVANMNRPMTSAPDELCKLAQLMERASRLSFTDIINNTNIAAETTPEILAKGAAALEEVSDTLGIPVTAHTGLSRVVEALPESLKSASYPIGIYIKMPWEICM